MQELPNVSLVMWNLGKGAPPLVTTVREALGYAGLDGQHAEDIPISTAFRRACDSQRNNKTLVRVFKSDQNNDLHARVDRQNVETSDLRNTRLGVYRCHESLVVRGVGDDFDSDMETALDTEFSKARRTYAWGDVSKVIQDVMKTDGLGAYSPRSSGGVYFVPINTQKPNMLNQLEQFCTYVGVDFLRYSVPDTEAQRSAIMDAVSMGIEQDVVAHEEAVRDYTEPPVSALERRKAGIESTQVLLSRLSHLLGDRRTGFNDRLVALLTRIEELRTAVSGPITMTHQPGARRVTIV